MAKKEKKSPNIKKTAHIRGLEIEYTPHATFAGIAKDIFTSETSISVDTLYDVVKHCPEANACFLAQIEDIAADYWRFTALTSQGKDIKSDKTAKSTLAKAKEFETKSDYYHKFVDAGWDSVVTGNGYILKLSVDKEKLKSIMENMTRYLAKKFNVKMKRGEIFKFIKQDWKDIEVPNDLQVLKSSTVKINFDKTGEIASYTQEVKGEKRVYRPEDIIHLKSNSIGGQPYGYSRLEPLLSDIGTLIFAKEFAGKYFENDGIPYFIFMMPDESPGGRNYKLLKKELRDLRKKGEKYKSLVLTGNVQNEQVNKFNKDMEFAKLIEHFTINIFVGLGVPAYRVNYTPQQKDVAAQNLGKLETGYYKRIAFLQKSWESILNKHLWSLFNVKKTFKRSYKIDEMREAEIIRILTEVGAITLEEARERIGMDPEIPKGTMAKTIGSDKRIDMDKDKKREQGTDTEQKDKMDNKLKSVSKSFMDAIDVPFSNFVIVVEHHVGINNFDKGKVLYIETPDSFTLYFSDGIWKYKTVVDKNKVNNEQFKTERLRNFIKISP
jgi:HK97 family phage portal protein